jgi:hypothetical protein
MPALGQLFNPTIPPRTETSLSIDRTLTLSAAGLFDTIASAQSGQPKPLASNVTNYAWSVEDSGVISIGTANLQSVTVTGVAPGVSHLQCILTDITGATHVFRRPFRVPDASTFYFHASSPTAGALLDHSEAYTQTVLTNGVNVTTEWPAEIEFRPDTMPADFTLTATARDERGQYHADFDTGLTSISWVMTGGTAALFDDGAGNPVPHFEGALNPDILIQGTGIAYLTLSAVNSLGEAISAHCALLILGPTSADFEIA